MSAVRQVEQDDVKLIREGLLDGSNALVPGTMSEKAHDGLSALVRLSSRLQRLEQVAGDIGQGLYDERFRARLLRHALSQDEVEQLVDAIEAMQARALAALEARDD